MDFFDTSNLPTNLAKRSFAANLFRLFPNARGGAPLFALTGMAKEHSCTNTSHGFWLKSAVFPKFELTTGITTDTETTFIVSETKDLKVGGLYRFRPAAGAGLFTPAELVQIEAINSSTEISVARGAADTTALASIDSGSVFVETGNAYEQGSTMPGARAILPEYFTNHTQIFRDAWDLSGTLAAISMETGYDSMQENKKDAAFFHAQAVETALFFGNRSSGTKNGRPFTTMDGVENTINRYAAGNLKEAGAETGYDDLEDMLNPLLDNAVDGRSTMDRTIFCGSKAIQVINNIGRKSGEFVLEQGSTSFGLQFTKFKTSRGNFSLIEHPLFNTNDDWKKMAVVMDLPSFDVVNLRKTFHKDIAHDGRDAMSGVYTTELTSMMVNPASSGIIYNLTKGVA